MTGIELKAILKRTGKQLNEIAALINISPQNLNQVLNSKDVKSGVIESLANELNLNVCDFYGGGDKVSAINSSLAIRGQPSRHRLTFPMMSFRWLSVMLHGTPPQPYTLSVTARR